MKLLLPLFFLCTLLSFGQNTTQKDQQRDSIVYYLKYAKGNIKLSYLKRAIDLSKEIQNDSLLKESSVRLGFSYYSNRDTLGLRKVNESLFYLFYKNKDSISLAKYFHFKALIFRIQKRLDSAFYYYNESKNISIKIKDFVEAGGRCYNLSYMQKDGKDYVGAEASIIEALKYLEPLKEFKYTPNSYNTLGHILYRTKRYEEALKYYKRSLNSNNKNPSNRARERWGLLISNNIGHVYLVQGKAKKALSYFKKALEYDSIATKHPYYYQLLLGNYSDSNYLLGNTKEAWKDFWKLLRFREKNKNIFGQGVSHNGFAYYFMLEGNNKKALYHARKSYALTKKVNNNFTRTSVLIKLAKLTSGNEAKKYFEEYVALNDSLRGVELKLKNDFNKIRYETEKKEKINLALRQENELKQAAIKKAEQEKIIGWLAAIAMLLVFVLSVNFFRNRRKKMLYESQLEKAKAREQERQQIAKSLHDEVAGDLRMLHQKLDTKNQKEEAESLEQIKENVRKLSHQLSSVHFEEVSFKDQMINLATDYFSKDFKVFVKGMDEVVWKDINETIKRTMYLCIRESLQNTIKYAEATRFEVYFSLHKKEIKALAKDNGKGFDPKEIGKGIGLKNIEERVQEIRGTLAIESSNKGTEIKISIPTNGK
ncbi:MAG: tetratricopeptide repeat protein [Flavobacteriaceae bacterium]